MTAILPRTAEPSTPDPLRLPLVQLLDSALVENAMLRAQLAALVDAVVAEQMVVPRNRSEHPYTPEQLAAIETRYRNHWGQIALNAAKEQ
jgi:hypothetical protein